MTQEIGILLSDFQFKKNMHYENSIKKIRTQLKFGRVVNAGSALTALLNTELDAAAEIELLSLAIFDLHLPTGDYITAQADLRRLKTLPISTELHQRIDQALTICHEEMTKQVSEPNYQAQKFVDFTQAIPDILDRLINTTKDSACRWVDTTLVEEAIQLAHHQNICPPFISWNGVRTQASKEVHSFCFENKINFSGYDRYADHITNLTLEKLNGEIRYFGDDVFSDLILIGHGILVGVSTKLHEIMYEAYLSGYFPCGWRGSYPDGELIVFNNTVTRNRR